MNDNYVGTLSLGERLRQYREAVGMSVEQVARESNTSARYVRALEEGDWTAFSAKVYAAGALRRISTVCARADTAVLMRALDREWPYGGAADAHPGSGRRLVAGLFLTPRRIGALAIAAFSIFLIGFWGLPIFIFSLPPALTVESPAPYSRVSASTVSVKGNTEKESRLTVNGREITIDERGAFREDIELPLGTNRLEFITESKFGKITKDIRYIRIQ